MKPVTVDCAKVKIRCFFESTMKSELLTPNIGNKSSRMSVHKVSNRYKCTKLLNNLNIECTPSNLLILWNKYQIFVYEGSLESPTKIFLPEYQVHRLLVTEDHFLCLDTNGYVHITDFTKNVDQILPHQPQAQGIKACVIFSKVECLSLKYDSDSYYLCVNKIHSNYQDLKKVKLSAKGPWPLQDGAKDKYILTHKKIDVHCLGVFQKLFNTESLPINAHFIAISFDKHTVYGCLCDLNENEDKLDLVKIFSCPSEICSIEIVGTGNTYLVIGLKMGTVIQLTLNDLNHCCGSFPMGLRTDSIHLNSGLHKFLVSNDTLMYTDGVTMWRADNVFTKDITFKQFFVKNINDFILHGDTIICTTFTKMIYTFLLDAEESYLKLENKDYNPANEVLKNSEYLSKIFQEVEKSKELAKQLSIEGSYIAAMSLSKRHEIMDKAINVSVTVCGSFEEVLQEIDEEVTLPEDLSKYMESSVYLLLIKVKIEEAGSLYDIVSDIIANSETEIHVSLSNDTKIFKTASVQISKMNFLIPHYMENETEINVNIRMVARVPGTYSKNQKIWIELYRKDIKKTAENFIQPSHHRSHQSKLFCVKERAEDFDKAIIECTNMKRKEFHFVDTLTAPVSAHVMYLRLPRTFKYTDFSKYLSKMKSKFLIDTLSTDEFLKSKNEIKFLVGKEAVEISIENDGFSTPCLKVLSGSIKVTSSLRVFFSDIIYGDNDCDPGEDFIKLNFYTTVENLKKNVKDCIANSASYYEFAPVKENFERIIGLLPI